MLYSLDNNRNTSGFTRMAYFQGGVAICLRLNKAISVDACRIPIDDLIAGHTGEFENTPPRQWLPYSQLHR